MHSRMAHIPQKAPLYSASGACSAKGGVSAVRLCPAFWVPQSVRTRRFSPVLGAKRRSKKWGLRYKATAG